MSATNRQIATPILIVFILILQSCAVSYGDHTKVDYTEILSKECTERAPYIHLFYEGEEIDFNYVKIGEVESIGEEFATNEELLDQLKYQAWMNCANGLINIKSAYKDRDQGVLFDPESEDTYSSKYYQALAVQVQIDSAFTAKHGAPMDTTFVGAIQNDQAEHAQQVSNELAGSFFGGVLAILILLITMSGS